MFARVVPFTSYVTLPDIGSLRVSEVGSEFDDARRIASIAESCLDKSTARSGSETLLAATSDVNLILQAVEFAPSSGSRKLLFVRARTLLQQVSNGSHFRVPILRALQISLDAGDRSENFVQLVLSMAFHTSTHDLQQPQQYTPSLAYTLFRALQRVPLTPDMISCARSSFKEGEPLLSGIAYVLAQDPLFASWDSIRFSDDDRAFNFLASSCALAFVFKPSPAFIRFLEEHVESIPSRASRRSFVDRFAPHLQDRLLFLEPEEENLLHRIVDEDSEHDIQQTATHLRELQSSLSLIPLIRAPGNPLSDISIDELTTTLRFEVESDCCRTDVILLLLLRMCSRFRDVADDDLVELDSIFVKIFALGKFPPCLRLAVALFGFCDVEPLLVTRQVPLDEVALEYFSHKLPFTLIDLVTDTLNAESPWSSSSSYLEILLGNFSQQFILSGSASETQLASVTENFVQNRSLPPVDALSLLACITYARSSMCTAADMELACMHMAAESEDLVSAARRFALIALNCVRSKDRAMLLCVIESSSPMSENKDLAFIHAQILLGVLRSCDDSDSEIVSSAITALKLSPWTALLLALHFPHTFGSNLSVLLDPGNEDEFIALCPLLRLRLIDGSLYALYEADMLSHIDVETATLLVTKLCTVLGGIRSSDLALEVNTELLPFSSEYNFEVNLFPQCDLSLPYSRTTPILSTQWPSAERTLLRAAIDPESELGALTRNALYLCKDKYTLPSLR